MSNYLGSSILTSLQQVSLHNLLDMVKTGRIDLNAKFSDPFRWSKKKKSRVIENLLLGLPSPHLWVEETPFGDLNILEGAELVEAVKSFIDNDFNLHDMRYLTHLNEARFIDLSYFEVNTLYDSNLLLREIRHETHPRYKCELYRSIHQGSGTKYTSQKARGYAFKKAYDLLCELSKTLHNAFYYQSSNKREDEKNEAKRHEFLLMIILFLYFKEEGFDLNQNYKGEYRYNIENTKISPNDYLNIALDKVMMMIDTNPPEADYYFDMVIESIESAMYYKKIDMISTIKTISNENSDIHASNENKIINHIYKELFYEKIPFEIMMKIESKKCRELFK